MRSFNGTASAIVFWAVGALAVTGCIGRAGEPSAGDEAVGEDQAADQSQQTAPGAPWGGTAAAPGAPTQLPGGVDVAPAVPGPGPGQVFPGQVGPGQVGPGPGTQGPAPVTQGPGGPVTQGGPVQEAPTCNCGQQAAAPPQAPPQQGAPPPQQAVGAPIGAPPIFGGVVGAPIVAGCGPCVPNPAWASPLLGFFAGLPLCIRI